MMRDLWLLYLERYNKPSQNKMMQYTTVCKTQTMEENKRLKTYEQKTRLGRQLTIISAILMLIIESKK